jgi:lysyl-tRNA synthetase class 1
MNSSNLSCSRLWAGAGLATLRAWFSCLYEVLLGAKAKGHVLVGSLRFYGVEEACALIERTY